MIFKSEDIYNEYLCNVLQFLGLFQECKYGLVLENSLISFTTLKNKGKNPYDYLIRVTKTFDKIQYKFMIKKVRY